MSLETYLETLRAKPEHIRRRVAFWTSAGITGLIFMFWLASFSVNGMAGQNHPVIADTVDKAGTPAQSLIAGVGSFFGDIKDMIFGSKKIVYSTVEVGRGNR